MSRVVVVGLSVAMETGARCGSPAQPDASDRLRAPTVHLRLGYYDNFSRRLTVVCLADCSLASPPASQLHFAATERPANTMRPKSNVTNA